MSNLKQLQSAAAEKQNSVPETVHDFLRPRGGDLDVFFYPNNVAVIGATETPGSVGKTVLQNLIHHPFGGTIFPVNVKRKNVMGIKAYASVKDVPAQVDLAVIVTPSTSVPNVVKECVEAGVKGAIIISAGFKEIGESGAQLERQVIEIAKKGNMRIIGPNCLGVMNPRTGFNATFSLAAPRSGHVAFISQSGALLTAILDWSNQQLVGFSSIVSVGSMLDVGWGDLIDYLGDDPETNCIVIYMETIGDARSFLSAAREVALNKPIIVIKPGQSEEAAKAAASHTGSLAGSDDVLDAAFRRCGVLRVQRIADIFHMVDLIGKQPTPKGPRLAVVTNAGGPAVIATDALLASGGKLATLTAESIQKLNEFLPSAWSHSNPIDILGDAGPDRYAKALEIVAADPNIDGMLVILTPQSMTDPTASAEALKGLKLGKKPLLASWMGGPNVEAGVKKLHEANIPDFSYPDTAARAFVTMWRYSDNLRALYETPVPASIAIKHADREAKMKSLFQKVKAARRTLLTEAESKEVLATYEIPTVPTEVAKTPERAVAIAKRMGFPVVLKLHSETVTHKTDVKGVELDLTTPAQVKQAFASIKKNVTAKVSASAFNGVTVQPMIKRAGYEIILGSSLDPQFGPVLLFGMGGQLVEVFKDKSLGLPPLNTTLARRIIERTKIFKALKGVRGRSSVDISALEKIMVRFSQFVVENPRVKEVDINPLLASPEAILALDARIILHDWSLSDKALPSSAIRPYPSQYVKRVRLRSGEQIIVRPILHEDEPAMVKFHEALSEQSVYLRYFEALKLDQRVTHERLARRCFIDYRREMALVVEKGIGKNREIIGVGRLSRYRGHPEKADFAMLVADKSQRLGIGSLLLKTLMEVAEKENIKTLTGDVLSDNSAMLKMCRAFGFKVEDHGDRMVVTHG